MAQKEDLKELLEQYFPDNNTGEITEPKVREFLGKVIDLIPEIAGGDLTGTFPNPTIGPSPHPCALLPGGSTRPAFATMIQHKKITAHATRRP